MAVFSKQQNIVTDSIAILVDLAFKKRNSIKKRQSKRCWLCKLFKERKSSGFFHVLIKVLEMFGQEYFFRFLSMSPDHYEVDCQSWVMNCNVKGHIFVSQYHQVNARLLLYDTWQVESHREVTAIYQQHPSRYM